MTLFSRGTLSLAISTSAELIAVIGVLCSFQVVQDTRIGSRTDAVDLIFGEVIQYVCVDCSWAEQQMSRPLPTY